jgi:proteasome accessory factor C
MSETAAAQLRRLLHVIPRIADGQNHPIAEVAELADADIDSLLSDLESLADRFDVPGGFVEGVQILVDGPNVAVFSDHLRRPMRLTMPELCALELGLAMLRTERAPDERGAIDRALARLRETITKLPSNDRYDGLRHAELAAAGDAESLSIIRRGLVARRKVRIRYRSGSATTATERAIAPFGLAFSSGMWYVVAHCERSDDLRVFRMDRVEDATATDERFDEPAEGVLESILRRGRMLSSDRPERMTVRYSPRVARWIAEREGQALSADGSLTMEHPLADPAWGVRHVLQYGAEAEVIAPEWVRERVVERLRTTLLESRVNQP